MKPLFENGKLVVKLYKCDIALLQKAKKEIGQVLTEINRSDLGDPLVEAIDAVLKLPPVSED